MGDSRFPTEKGLQEMAQAAFAMNPEMWQAYQETMEAHIQGCRKKPINGGEALLAGTATFGGGAYQGTDAIIGKVPEWSASSSSTSVPTLDPHRPNLVDSISLPISHLKKTMGRFADVNEDLLARLPLSRGQSDLEDWRKFPQQLPKLHTAGLQLSSGTVWSYPEQAHRRVLDVCGQSPCSAEPVPGPSPDQAEASALKSELLAAQAAQARERYESNVVVQQLQAQLQGLRGFQSELQATEAAHEQERFESNLVVNQLWNQLQKLQDANANLGIAHVATEAAHEQERCESDTVVQQLQVQLRRLKEEHANVMILAHAVREDARRGVQIERWEVEGDLRDSDNHNKRVRSLEQEFGQAEHRVCELEEVARVSQAERAKLAVESSEYRENVVELERLLSEAHASRENANLAMLRHHQQVKELSHKVAYEQAAAESRDHECSEHRFQIHQLLQGLVESRRVELDHVTQHSVHRQQVGRLEEDLAASSSRTRQLLQDLADCCRVDTDGAQNHKAQCQQIARLEESVAVCSSCADQIFRELAESPRLEVEQQQELCQQNRILEEKLAASNFRVDQLSQQIAGLQNHLAASSSLANGLLLELAEHRRLESNRAEEHPIQQQSVNHRQLVISEEELAEHHRAEAEHSKQQHNVCRQENQILEQRLESSNALADQLSQELSERRRVEVDYHKQHNLHCQQIRKLEGELAECHMVGVVHSKQHDLYRCQNGRLEDELAASHSRADRLCQELAERNNRFGKSIAKIEKLGLEDSLPKTENDGAIGLAKSNLQSSEAGVLGISGLGKTSFPLEYAPSETSDPTISSGSRQGTEQISHGVREAPLPNWQPLYANSMSLEHLADHHLSVAGTNLEHLVFFQDGQKAPRLSLPSSIPQCSASMLEPRLSLPSAIQYKEPASF